MSINQSKTESLIDIIKSVDKKSLMLPEFQRDFRWEVEKTYDLFDSLIREIFIGTIIYGKPSFGMTLRELDTRPRKGVGSNAKLKTQNYSEDEIKIAAQAQDLRIVLDGQQRTTSIYRACKGLDSVYIVIKAGLDPDAMPSDLETIVESIGGTDSKTNVCIKISDAYEAEEKNWLPRHIDQRFKQSAYAQSLKEDEQALKIACDIYHQVMHKTRSLLDKQSLVAYYLLDMNLDKFCLFFERSNSKLITLSFTDILAAKLYHGFNLRQKIEAFESQYQNITLNREIVVRALAYIVAQENNKPVKIDRSAILANLEATDFQNHWDAVCKLYVESLAYLADQHYILSQDWMPSENMIIPIMVFLRKVKDFSQMTQPQREFLQFWYWSSVFSNRYSTSSNETIITDCGVLRQVANGERINIQGYFGKLRSLVTEPEDLLSYNRKASSVYRGILNVINFASQGLLDWNNTQKLNMSMRLEDHHIYPRAYVTANASNFNDIDADRAEQFVDCVANRTLIPKLTNISIGKKAPHTYLREIEQTNNCLPQCLETHLILTDLLTNEDWNLEFNLFLQERAERMFALIEAQTTDLSEKMFSQHGLIMDSQNDTPGKQRLSDFIESGKVQVGERVYVKKQPNEFASIVDGQYVEYNGQKMLINTWGQKMTGWSSISIYDSVMLARNGQPLKSLRDPV